jgi:hypothetical protein
MKLEIYTTNKLGISLEEGDRGETRKQNLFFSRVLNVTPDGPLLS